MEKRTLIALAISFVFLMSYPLVLQHFYPNYMKKAPATAATSSPKETQAAPASAVSSTPAAVLRAGELIADEDLPFKTGTLDLVFNKKSGVIRGIAFSEFIHSQTGRPLELLSLQDSKAAPTLLSFIEPARAPHEMHFDVRTSGSTVEMSAAASSQFPVSVKKIYSFDPSGYSAKLSLVLENQSDQPIDLRYELFAGSRIPPRESIDGQYLEGNFYSVTGDKGAVRHIRGLGLGKQTASEGPVQWVAIKDRHFSIILKPGSLPGFTGLVRGFEKHLFGVSAVSPGVSIPARSSVRHEFILYIGPNEIEKLLPLGLDPIVNFGKLDWIGKLLIGGLELLNRVFKNYGIAIIALTALINLLLFPLTRVSYLSMKRMQLIQPQLTKLREHHKKNPEKLNKEMMELYKKHKVNPFGGCLPMILQMPVFIALYVALSKSATLINSKFFWAQDLSSPDNLTLPFVLPVVGNQIHVLPLVMVGAMFFQQRFTQIQMTGQDPAMQAQQKMMAVMMPILFGFIFYSMPSGLVLYWLTNTLIMTAYQLRLKNMTLA